MVMWVCNTCSISGKTDKSLKRKDHLKDLIQSQWPEIIVLVETNHDSNVSILEGFYDVFSTPPCESQGVIILTKKLLGMEQVDVLQNRGIAIRSRIIQNFVVVGIYCPYYNQRFETISFLKKHQKNQWLIAGDLESYGEYIINQIDNKYWDNLDFTRERNGAYSKTEFIGYFYNKPVVRKLEQLSDHFLLETQIETTWDGLQIDYPTQIARIPAVCTIKNKRSIAAAELLSNWPAKSFYDTVYGLIPFKKRSIKIYRSEISLNDVNGIMAENYKKRKMNKIMNNINNSLRKNDLKTSANIAAKCLHIQRRNKGAVNILGISDENGKIYIGNDANEMILKYYEKIFNENLDLNFSDNNTPTNINLNENILEFAFEKLNRKKAMGMDQCPDEILDIPYIKTHITSFLRKTFMSGDIPAYLKYGKLNLLSKSGSNSFPKINDTRPIIILSPLYKIMELCWAYELIDILWANIGPHQIGFRKKGNTQFNIILLKKLMKQSKHALILFVDISKAYDSVIREKLFDLLAHIGIPSNYINFYKNLTNGMRIYLSETVFMNYTRGVPQGSTISPVLYNLYYEEALKKINPYTEKLLGFADDLALFMTNDSNLIKIQEILKQWKPDLNLLVHPVKTEALLYHLKYPKPLTYPITTDFKYLGVKFYNTKSQFTKTNIIKQISLYANNISFLYLKFSSLKLNKLVVSWWFLAKLFYTHISNVYLGFIDIQDFIKLIITKLKKLLLIKKGVPQKFIINLLNINLEFTVKEILSKIKRNCLFDIGNPQIQNFNNDIFIIKHNDEENKYWNYILTHLNININSLWLIFAFSWFDQNNKKYICKHCKMNLSLFHAQKSHIEIHPFLKSEYMKWIIEISETYDFLGSIFHRNISKDEGAQWIKKIMEDALECREKIIQMIGCLAEMQKKEVKKKKKSECKKSKKKNKSKKI